MSRQDTISIPLIPKDIVRRIKEEAKNLEEFVSAKMKKQYYESILQNFGKTQVPESLEDRALDEVENALIKGLKLQAFMRGLGIAKEEEKKEEKREAEPAKVEKVKTEEEIVADIVAKLVKEGMKPEEATRVAFRILNRGREEGMSLGEIARSYRELLKDIMDASKFKLEMLKEDLERLKKGSGEEGAIVQYLMSELEELKKANEELKKVLVEKEREAERRKYEQMLEESRRQIEQLRGEIESLREHLAEKKGPVSEAMSQYIEELVQRVEDMKKTMELLGYKVVAPEGVKDVLESKREMELRKELERLRKELAELREKTKLSQHLHEFIKTTLELAFRDPSKFRQLIETIKELIEALRGGGAVGKSPTIKTEAGGELFGISPDIFEKLEREGGEIGQPKPKRESKTSRIAIDWGEGGE